MKKNELLKAFENPDFLRSREARVLRILSEYIEPETRFEFHNIVNTIVFFGSARIKPDSKDKNNVSRFYHEAEDFAYKLSLLSKEIKEKSGEDIYICTGGGPGIMEAANKGASRAKMPNIGLNIDLPFEQGSNPYITPELF
ncbi:lysine decarboxylase, partial [Spirochaetota bacterium]